jgi:hypothetical protein
VALSVGEHAERHAGHLLWRLDDASAELLRALERGSDVLHADKEEDRVVAALERTDRRRERPVDPDANERVARKCAIGVGIRSRVS